MQEHTHNDKSWMLDAHTHKHTHTYMYGMLFVCLSIFICAIWNTNKPVVLLKHMNYLHHTVSSSWVCLTDWLCIDSLAVVIHVFSISSVKICIIPNWSWLTPPKLYYLWSQSWRSPLWRLISGISASLLETKFIHQAKLVDRTKPSRLLAISFSFCRCVHFGGDNKYIFQNCFQTNLI